jgi:hypothetical protein
MLLSATVLKPVPVTVTIVPGGPEAGEKEVMTGCAAKPRLSMVAIKKAIAFLKHRKGAGRSFGIGKQPWNKYPQKRC